MANIKFSQFTVGNTESDIDFVVGYKGANNIQISPANLLSATLAGYLPLTGGTMTGNVKFNDNIELRLGSGADLKAYHSGTNTLFDNNVGDLVFRNLANDKDIAFQSDDGSGGVTEYFRLDGTNQRNIFSKNVGLGDNVIALFGSGNDMQLFHDSVQSQILNLTGNLRIRNFSDDSDITFESDDGSGGIATYFYLDGSIVENRFSKATRHSDNIIAKFGDANDLNIYSNGSNSYIENFNNDFIISNTADDKDIRFFCDDGSGGTTEYFRVDGGNENIAFSKNIAFPDNVQAQFGSALDLRLVHTGSDSYIQQTGFGDLIIQQTVNDADISFQCDNGSGGVTEYFRLDGSAGVVIASKEFRFVDNVPIKLGTGPDFQMLHNGTTTSFENSTGNLKFTNFDSDSDIIFQNDNGAGSVTPYITLDGTNKRTKFSEDILIADTKILRVGSGADLQIVHDGTDSLINNYNGHLYISNLSDDKDIYFRSDDGSGGVTTYFQLNGFAVRTDVLQNFRTQDSIKFQAGSSGDLELFHNGTDSFIENQTGQLNIVNYANDKDIRFWSDDGSGGITTYFQLDGSIARTLFSRNTQHVDNSKAIFGSGDDLQIYHNGSNSFISDTGVGLLVLSTNHLQVYNSSITEVMITAVENGAVNLYYDNVKKLETTTTGIKITGVSEYADNTAAIAGGLTTGDVYRTGDLLKIVH